jgi:hypothetical protein
VIGLVDLLGDVMTIFKEALLVNFWVECVVVLLIGSMVSYPYHFLLFTMNSFICAIKNKKHNVILCNTQKNGDKTKVN